MITEQREDGGLRLASAPCKGTNRTSGQVLWILRRKRLSSRPYADKVAGRSHWLLWRQRWFGWD